MHSYMQVDHTVQHTLKRHQLGAPPLTFLFFTNSVMSRKKLIAHFIITFKESLIFVPCVIPVLLYYCGWKKSIAQMYHVAFCFLRQTHLGSRSIKVKLCSSCLRCFFLLFFLLFKLYNVLNKHLLNFLKIKIKSR